MLSLDRAGQDNYWLAKRLLERLEEMLRLYMQFNIEPAKYFQRKGEASSLEIALFDNYPTMALHVQYR